MKVYTAVGVMSGTSLDGLDLCLSTFGNSTTGWNYKIHKAETIPYTSIWKERLAEAQSLPARDYVQLDFEYGKFIGAQVKKFLRNYNGTVNIIASHGHTVFHQPHAGFTSQIGNGASIAATCRISTISDFRSLDLAIGGQGAPLVPLGDELLFSQFPYCLNLGGFSNISFLFKKKRIAFDICPVNTILNDQARLAGMEYDQNGELGQRGQIISSLLENLNSLPYYHKKPPKSLGREWVKEFINPAIAAYANHKEDVMHTLYMHISDQLSRTLNETGKSRKKVLLTGGGAFNTYLINLVQSKTHHELIIPSADLINFKESLIFAFLGVLRFRNQANCLSSVTGACFDTSGGAMHLIL
jgi:anhydro-N-acetylmuramic acid kinase